MIFSILIIILPLFVSIGAGFGMSKLFDIDEHTLTRVLTDFFMPALVFNSLATSNIIISETIRLFGATTFAIIMLLIMALVYCKISGGNVKELATPICFMNSGFIGIPLMMLWGGAEAMNADVIIDQVQTFYLFTLGIIIVSGGFTVTGLKEMVKTPLLWAIAAGFFLNFTELKLPDTVNGIFNFCGSGTSALAAFTVGCAMSKRRIKPTGHLAAGLVIRFAGGFAAGWAAATVFHLTGTTRTVMIVATSLPSAVFAYVLPLRYGVDTETAGSMVVVSTILGIVFIPAAFWLAQVI